MYVRLLVAVAVWLSMFGAWLPAATELIEGHYTCAGTDMDGRPYAGLELAVTMPKGVALLVWSERGLDTARGIGVLRDGVLSVAYVTAQSTIGVVAYQVSAGRLDGLWSIGGPLLPEVCTTAGAPA